MMLNTSTDTGTNTGTNIGATSYRYLAALAAMLQQQGYDTGSLLDDTQLCETDLQQTDRFLNYPQTRQIIGNAITLTQNPHLGLLLGRTLNVSSHGTVGMAALTASNLREAIQTGIQYCGLITSLFTPQLDENAREASLIVTPNLEIDDETERFAMETLMSSIEVMVRFLIGKQLGTTTVELPWAEDVFLKGLLEQYERDAPVNFIFNASHYCIRFPAQILDISLTLSNQTEYQKAVQECQQRLSHLSPEHTLSQQVSDYLTRHPGKVPQMEAFAQTLNISSRTLLRQLQKEGTTWRKLVSHCRISQAKKLLLQENKSITETAFLLGYGDSANFTRAFRRETGMAPSRFISQQKKGTVQ